MADNLIPLSSLLGEESDQDSSSQIVPLSSLLGEEQGPVPGAAAKRVPTSMDRGISLPVNTPVVEPLLGMQWAGKARDRLMLGFEEANLTRRLLTSCIQEALVLRIF